MSGAQLEKHVLELASQLSVRVRMPKRTDNRFDIRGQAHINVRKVYLTHRPRKPEAYLVALHELGHFACPGPRGLENELEAWQWARDHSKIEVDEAAISERIETYQ